MNRHQLTFITSILILFGIVGYIISHEFPRSDPVYWILKIIGSICIIASIDLLTKYTWNGGAKVDD